MKLAIGMTLIQCSAAFAQQAVQTAKLGVLEGRVLNSQGGEPIRKAMVTLQPVVSPGGSAGSLRITVGPMPPTPRGAAPYAASTDAEGKFRIADVEPGTYRLMAERQGFIRGRYALRPNSMIGATISVTAGMELKNLDIKMTPQGVITGRVLDDEGEPLAKVQITVLRQLYVRGTQQMMPMGGGQTIDTGEFRVSDLTPGRYWLSASWRGRMNMFGEAPRTAGDQPEEEYITTYYPGATEQSSARFVEVSAGQVVSGIDIPMRKARVYRVRGKVAADGQAMRNIRLMLLPRERSPGMGFSGNSGAAVKEDGTFEMAGVAPGSYYITVVPLQGMLSVRGRAPVDVTRDNVDGVVLTLGKTVTLNGDIRIEGGAAAAGASKVTFDSVRVQLTPADGMPFGVPGAAAKADGSFAVENVGPDKYHISAFNLPAGTWVKSIRVGDQEAMESGFEVSGGSPGDVRILLGVGAGAVSGLVQDAKQKPSAGSLVMLMVDPMKVERYDRNRVATADQNGQFTLEGIVPGEYKLYAWEEVDVERYMDPEFLKAHESKARKLMIEANGAQQVTVTAIPAEAQ